MLERPPASVPGGRGGSACLKGLLPPPARGAVVGRAEGPAGPVRLPTRGVGPSRRVLACDPCSATGGAGTGGAPGRAAGPQGGRGAGRPVRPQDAAGRERAPGPPGDGVLPEGLSVGPRGAAAAPPHASAPRVPGIACPAGAVPPHCSGAPRAPSGPRRAGRPPTRRTSGCRSRHCRASAAAAPPPGSPAPACTGAPRSPGALPCALPRPCPCSSRSSTSTDRPRRAADQAVAARIGPLPMTIRSVRSWQGRLRSVRGGERRSGRNVPRSPEGGCPRLAGPPPAG